MNTIVESENETPAPLGENIDVTRRGMESVGSMKPDDIKGGDRGILHWITTPVRLIRSARRAATPVNTRLTREGWQFLFIISFVVLGAVLRDVNLLVILAGSLLAFLLVQWRICAKSLYGLAPHRRLPRSMQARKDFEIELSVRNPKRWLGSWLVLVQERLIHRPVANSARPVSQSIGVLFHSIPPGASRSQKYRCRVSKRGLYQYLPTEITTRFPMGLMRGILPVGGEDTFVVQPAIGKLQPGWFELFESKSSGLRQRRSRSLSDEGEFFGLRAYRPGDSLRWIHWRSSARLNELMVKQYQRSDSRELVVVLDLYLSPEASKKERDEYEAFEDLAVEFIATIANFVAASNFAILTVAIADAAPAVASRIQTRSQNVSLLDRLGTAHCGSKDTLPKALELLEREHRRIEHMIVISTRSQSSVFSKSASHHAEEVTRSRGSQFAGGIKLGNIESSSTIGSGTEGLKGSKNAGNANGSKNKVVHTVVNEERDLSPIVFWKHCKWVDVTKGELAPYFSPEAKN